MLEDLDALTVKLQDIAARMRVLRDENLALRAQLGASHQELDLLRARVNSATHRLDELIAQLPLDGVAGSVGSSAAASPTPAAATAPTRSR